MKNYIREAIEKTTLSKPVSDQSKRVDADFKRNLSAGGVKLNEVDGLLSEVEQSLKKKIFSLAKMEALVFSDPKLTAVYNEMSENGEEKYGYHYNETIQNMIFNDYVLNSPKYLQKYKMAIPKKKKRRDKSGINQLKKSGAERMEATGLPKQPNKPEVEETTGAAGGGAGAFVPALSYEKEIEESTTSASSGAYAGPAAWGGGDLMKGGKSKAMRKPIWKGGTIVGECKVNYLVDPSGFAKYIQTLNEQIDIENPEAAQKPNVTPYTNKAVNDKIIDKTAAFSSNTVKQWDKPDTELELHTVNSGIVEESTEQKISTLEQAKAFLKQKKANGGSLAPEDIPMFADDALYRIAMAAANSLMKDKVQASWDELQDVNSLWDYIKKEGGMTFDELAAAVKKAVNDRIIKTGYGLDEKASSPEQQRLFGMAHAAQKGEIPMSKLGGAAKKIAQTVSPKDVKDFASTKYDEMSENEQMGEFIVTKAR